MDEELSLYRSSGWGTSREVQCDRVRNLSRVGGEAVLSSVGCHVASSAPPQARDQGALHTHFQLADPPVSAPDSRVVL